MDSWCGGSEVDTARRRSLDAARADGALADRQRLVGRRARAALGGLAGGHGVDGHLEQAAADEVLAGGGDRLEGQRQRLCELRQGENAVLPAHVRKDLLLITRQ